MDYDFFRELPEDPEAAFSVYEALVRKEHTTSQGYGAVLDREAYICDIIGFLHAYNLDFGIEEDVPTDDYDFDEYFTRAQNKIRILTAKYRLNVARSKKSKISPAYIMTPSLRKQIHHFVDLIRDKIEDNQVPVDKRDRLMNKLDVFSAEVNRERSTVRVIGDTYVELMRYAGEGIKHLEPAVGYAERIMKAMSKAEESETPSLIEQEKRKAIEPPKNSKPADETEDEIPF